VPIGVPVCATMETLAQLCAWAPTQSRAKMAEYNSILGLNPSTSVDLPMNSNYQVNCQFQRESLHIYTSRHSFFLFFFRSSPSPIPSGYPATRGYQSGASECRPRLLAALWKWLNTAAFVTINGGGGELPRQERRGNDGIS
jgi:hypothetical protein